jgi:large subunit ribosomal protein L18
MRIVPKRRRRENKTDYRARFDILKSKLDRIVIRKTNKYIAIQQVSNSEAQDFVKVGITSKELLEHGWSEKNAGSLKSLPASYITGLLAGKKIGKGKFIVDFGMIKNNAGSRVYAALKGLIDAGLEINANEKIFPSKERLEGSHLKPELKEMIKKVKEKVRGAK